MADEPKKENLIVVFAEQKSVNPIHLFPGADRDMIFRQVARSNVYSHLYSLSYGLKVEVGDGRPAEIALKLIDCRPPFDRFTHIRQILSTKWLGACEDSIDEDIRQINETLQALKAERLAQKF